MVAVEKFPLASRLTSVLAVSVLVAVSPSVTAPPAGRGGDVRVAGHREHSGIVQVIVFPRPTVPPPLKPGPGFTVTAE